MAAAMMTPTDGTVPRRLLEDNEVDAIFNHVKNDSNLDHLPYQVILVDPEGSKISPPRQQFSDGLYMLCSFTNIHEVPKHLLDLMSDGPQATETFRWHPASGRDPRNAALRLRNCYRFTNEGGKMGGVRGYLWTMQGSNGTENLQYRLLHVYPEAIDQTASKSSRKYDAAKRKPLALRSKSMDNIPSSNPPQSKEKERPLKPIKTQSLSTTSTVPSISPCAPPSLLSHGDVSAIFASVYNNEKPPPHLMYQVVIATKTTPNKVQVTPPQLQYRDGIYIVCQECPAHLQSRLMQEKPKPAISFRWNASGPRPWNKHVMVRTCNALKKKGEGGKQYGKSATVYTRVTNGREDLRYRLLHIHAPNIRAAPKGTTSSKASSKSKTLASRAPRTKKRPQVDKENNATRTSASRTSKKKKQRPQVVDKVNGCQVCGTDGHPKCLMECDGCQRRYAHTFCIGLMTLPFGDWYCTKCMSRKIAAANASAKRPQTTVSKDPKNSSIHFKLIRCKENTTESAAEVSLSDQLGFLVVDSRDASFEQVRTAVTNEIDRDLLPGNDWKFMVASSLGPLTKFQEKAFGSVKSFYEKTFGSSLGDGSAQNPFQLFLLCPKYSP